MSCFLCLGCDLQGGCESAVKSAGGPLTPDLPPKHETSTHAELGSASSTPLSNTVSLKRQIPPDMEALSLCVATNTPTKRAHTFFEEVTSEQQWAHDSYASEGSPDMS